MVSWRGTDAPNRSPSEDIADMLDSTVFAKHCRAGGSGRDAKPVVRYNESKVTLFPGTAPGAIVENAIGTARNPKGRTVVIANFLSEGLRSL